MSNENIENETIKIGESKGLTIEIVPTLSQITETPSSDQTITTTVSTESPNINGDKK